MRENTAVVTKESAPHFIWGDVCDGWELLDTSSLHVIRERMPPGTFELRHLHQHVRQLYFVLEGTASVDLDGKLHTLAAGEAIVIEPPLPHQMRNDSSAPLEFLVISSAPPRDDRHDLD